MPLGSDQERSPSFVMTARMLWADGDGAVGMLERTVHRLRSQIRPSEGHVDLEVAWLPRERVVEDRQREVGPPPGDVRRPELNEEADVVRTFPSQPFE